MKQRKRNNKIHALLITAAMTICAFLPLISKVSAAGTIAGGFFVEGGSDGVDFDYADGVLTILTDTPLRISNEGTISDRIVVTKDINANITLAGVDLKPQKASLEIAANSAGNVTITLADATTNRLRGYNTTAALQKNGAYSDTLGTLTIRGETNETGILIAEGGAYDTGRFSGSAAAIGSSKNNHTANIIINSGTIVAIGGNETDTGSAAIGSGDGGNARHIEINGGIITATGGENSGAIGAGWDGSASDIIIRGGSLKAIPVSNGHAIGDGLGKEIIPTNGSEAVYPVTIKNPNAEDVYINDVLYPYKNQAPTDPNDTSLYLYLPLPDFTVKVGERLHKGYFVDGEYHVVTAQDLIVTADDGSELIYNKDYTFPDNTQILTILSEKPMTIKNVDFDKATDNAIFIADGVSANLTLKGVNIVSKQPPFKIAENSKGNVTITLADNTENILCAGRGDLAGLEKNGGIDSGTLTINGNGTLIATGDWNSAGIGSNGSVDTANIVINSGTIRAVGGGTGAGIGAAQRGSAYNITINGGIITAIGGTRDVNGSPVYSPGIGNGARGGMTSNVIINGGSIIATSGAGSADSISTTPKNRDGDSLSLVKIANETGADITIDGQAYPSQHSDDDKNIYVYLTKDFHTVKIGADETKYKNYGSGSFLPVPKASDFIFKEPQNLVYTKDAVTLPSDMITGTAGMGSISVSYYLQSDPDTEITTPINAGTYIVKANTSKGTKYAEATAVTSADWTFTIAQASNEWIDKLSITSWTYNETMNHPEAVSKFGDVQFTYGTQENGPYTSSVPINAGTYYVKASVNETDNFTGLEEKASFTIHKAIPVLEEITDLTLVKGQALQDILLPSGYSWEDKTTIVTEVGTHQYKAIYTPDDIINYEIIEVLLKVEVLPTLTPLNHAPTISANDINLLVGDTFNNDIALQGITADDQEDGDLTDQIEIIQNTVDTTKHGIYEVTYKVTDSNGASVTKTIIVVVNPHMEEVNHAPIIIAADQTLNINDPFDPFSGISAEDKEDGNLTDQINIVKNTVDTTKHGIYEVTYTVTDSSGASVTKTIKVAVKANIELINHIPTITATDQTLFVGDTYSVLEGVTAFDQEDGDLTSRIEVIKNTVDTSKAGIYEVIYKVTDTNDASCTKTIYITIKPKESTLSDTKPNTENNKSKLDTMEPMPDSNQYHIEDQSIETGDSTSSTCCLILLILSGCFSLILYLLKKNNFFDK